VDMQMRARFHERGFCEYLAGVCGVSGRVGHIQFGVCGFDAVFSVADTRFCVQCRLSLGHEYPSVLRRVRAALEWACRDLRNDGKAIISLLLIGRHRARGLTLPQVGRMFWLSGIRVIQLHELLQAAQGTIDDERVVGFPASRTRW
jgi:hypothetical protein